MQNAFICDLVLLQFLDVTVERNGDENDVLDDKDDVEDQLPHQSRHVLQRLLTIDEKGVHLDEGHIPFSIYSC